MINAARLLADLTRLLKRLEDDLRQRIADVDDFRTSLKHEWQSARDADRTAETFESWADQVITQAGVHWLLSCVFIRFIEDNGLVDRPWLGGTPESGRLALARDRHDAYFRDQPLESDRDYLLAAFREAGALPGLRTFFDEAHNPVFRLGISGDAAMGLRQFWQQVDPNTGALLHDFTDPDWNTRFLGDLYQDLSEATRKRYALLQTPEFVEAFILDRTLTPAIHEFGFREVRMIDPTCGSGHFLLGGFHRLVDEWQRHEPARNPRDIAQKALDAVAGVDLNPFAVAISRFRLLVAALKVSDIRRLADAPDFKMNVAIGDSLLHGARFGMTVTTGMFEEQQHFAGTGLAHAYASEDLREVNRILGAPYHVVVGNPPYVIVKDASLNRAYRDRYASCHMKYSLGCPFTERFFEIAFADRGDNQGAGFVGLITTNSFMKRDFGVKLIENVLPKVDLTHVIDTSRAHIPGHGTPTVILFGRNRRPVAGTVRVAAGISAEEIKPSSPSQGEVWISLIGQLDCVGSKSRFVEVSDVDRGLLNRHPWSLGSEEITELKELIETNCIRRLEDSVSEAGPGCIVSEEEAFQVARRGITPDLRTSFREMVGGESVRDWSISEPLVSVVFPYSESIDLMPEASVSGFLWPFRTTLGSRKDFGNKTYLEANRPWWEYHQIPPARNRRARLITFAFVATHNHFVLAWHGRVFGRTAPIMVLPEEAPDSDHLALLSVLNSSVACFWLKQILMDRGGGGIGGGLATEPWERFYEHDAKKVLSLPLPSEMPAHIASKAHETAKSASLFEPRALLAKFGQELGLVDVRRVLEEGRLAYSKHRAELIGIQEELDWSCYCSYRLTKESLSVVEQESRGALPPLVQLGERAFEIVLARRVASGAERTAWFARHDSTLVTEIPEHWPDDYRHVVQRRIDLIESDRNIASIERPEYKRRWNTPAWEELEKTALRDWLLDRLEAPHLWRAAADQPSQLSTVNRLADIVRSDAKFMQVAELYVGQSGFEVAALVGELVASESVPFLPVLRYTDTGLRKRAQWEETWALQRREDAGENVGNIPVPPKYQRKDFLKTDYWRLRDGLDVPKERWISYPGCERGADGSRVIAWAGWNHLQQATAVAAYYLDMKDNEGWPPARLQPLLAGLLELVPWLEQWHNEVDPAYGERMGTYYRGFVQDEARALGFTLDDLRTWRPAAVAAKRGRRRGAAAP